jgi:tRNA modification GTPase
MSGEPLPNCASLLTPPGRGAVAVVAAEGPAAISAIDARFQAANGRPLAQQPLDRIAFGYWRDGDHAEEVILCRTNESRVEVHCHGGAAAAERILDALTAAGCRIEPWRDWAARHVASGLAAESELALPAAQTRRTAAILLDQHAGALAREIGAIRDDIAANCLTGARPRLAELAKRISLGLHLVQPWHVALAGAPNVGKSSLLNAILGYQRAIVFDQPGTTRDVLDATTAIDGWPIRLTDGAGIRESADSLEAAGVAQARAQLAQADLVLWILDATTLAPAARGLAAAARRACNAELAGRELIAPLLTVVNKIDLASPPTSYDAKETDPPTLVSAVTGAGLDELLAAIARRLVPNLPSPGEAVPFTPRQAELITVALERLNGGETDAAIDSLDRLAAPALLL